MLWLAALLVGGAIATVAPTTKAPTSAPTPFTVPKLPISKANAEHPDCRAEIIFVLDVSGSVNAADQQTLMRFTVQFMVEVERNVGDARFGVIIFGIQGADSASSTKTFNMAPFGGPTVTRNGPMGNQLNPGSEMALQLDHLRYNCTECIQATNVSNFSQLEYMWTLSYSGGLTPTWDGLDMAKLEYDTRGDKTVPGRFIVLLTDGVPNDAACYANNLNSSDCIRSINRTDYSVNATKNGTLLLTVGMNLGTIDQQALMIKWASQPKDILAVPSTDYSQLQLLIPKILSVLCPAGSAVDCLAEDATSVNIVGNGSSFLNTGTLGCRFYRDNEDKETQSRHTAAIWVNATLIQCPLPDSSNFFPGEWNLQYTVDGRGYYDGARFKFGTVCRPELLVIWWPFCALALLPLAFCRPKRVAPTTTTKVTRGVARPAPAATEEYEEYEEVEEIVAPPEPVNKWKVAPTAYIGFGRARMSVDWAGVAPESAPHEGVRKKVVKKVVTDHAPVPTAGPAGMPAPAQPAAMETTTTTTKAPIVEEPDWVNSFMDRVAAMVCCCCNKK